MKELNNCQMRKNGDYVPDKVTMKHIQETLQLLSVMTGDHRYEEAVEKTEEGGPKNMCEVLDRIENKGRLDGLREGRLDGLREGRLDGLREGRLDGLHDGRLMDIKNLMDSVNWTAEQAMDALKIPLEERASYLEKL